MSPEVAAWLAQLPWIPLVFAAAAAVVWLMSMLAPGFRTTNLVG